VPRKNRLDDLDNPPSFRGLLALSLPAPAGPTPDLFVVVTVLYACFSVSGSPQGAGKVFWLLYFSLITCFIFSDFSRSA
jgi:hypothetical protein